MKIRQEGARDEQAFHGAAARLAAAEQTSGKHSRIVEDQEIATMQPQRQVATAIENWETED